MKGIVLVLLLGSRGGERLADRGSGGGLDDHRGGLLADHNARRVSIARRDGRHDRGVGDAQAVDAVDTQLVVDDGLGAASHRRRADGMEMVVEMSPTARTMSASAWIEG